MRSTILGAVRKQTDVFVLVEMVSEREVGAEPGRTMKKQFRKIHTSTLMTTRGQCKHMA